MPAEDCRAEDRSIDMYALNEQLLQRIDEFVTGNAEQILVIVAKDSNEVRAAIRQSCENHQLTLARDCHYASNLPIPTSDNHLSGDVLLEDFIASDDLCDFDRIISSVIELKTILAKPIIVIGGFDSAALSRHCANERLVIERLGELSFVEWLQWAKADNSQLGQPNIHPLITSFLEYNPGKFNAQIQHGATWHIVNTEDWQNISNSIYRQNQEKAKASDPIHWRDEFGRRMSKEDIVWALLNKKLGQLPAGLTNLDPNDIEDIRLIIAGALACKDIADDFVAFHKGNGTLKKDESLERVSKESAVQSPSYLDDDGEPDWDEVHYLTFAGFLQWAKADNPQLGHPNIHPLITSFLEHNPGKFNAQIQHGTAWHIVNTEDWQYISNSIYRQNQEKLKYSDPENWTDERGGKLTQDAIDYLKRLKDEGIIPGHLGNLDPNDIDDIHLIIAGTLACEGIADDFVAFHKGKGTLKKDESFERDSKESAVQSPSYLDDDGEPDWDKVHYLTFAEFLQWAKAYNPYKKHPNIHPLLTSFIEHNSGRPIISSGYSGANVIAVSAVGVGEWYFMSEKIYSQNKNKLMWLEKFSSKHEDGYIPAFLDISSLELDNLDDIKRIVSNALRSEQIGEEFVAFHSGRK